MIRYGGRVGCNLGPHGTEEQNLFAVLRHAGPQAICIAAVTKTVDRVNDMCFQRLAETGNVHFSVYARHDPGSLTNTVRKPQDEKKVEIAAV